jgi:hypothetical protein
LPWRRTTDCCGSGSALMPTTTNCFDKVRSPDGAKRNPGR